MTQLKLLMLVAALAPLSTFAASFDGPYVGVVAGFASSKDKGAGYGGDFGVPPNERNGYTHKANVDSQLLGLSGGYNKIHSNNVLVGVEADWETRGSNTDHTTQKFHGVTDTDFEVRSKIYSVASLRARLGYKVDSNTLIYTTAGYATAKVSRRFDDLRSPTRSEFHSKWQDGWTAGIGAQYLIKPNLSVGLEYRYSDFGSARVSANLWNETYKEDLTEKSLRATLTYHF